jgi:nucleoside triphosphate pyrophosphatase
VSVPPAPPLILASQSPQRRAILEQLRIPFEVVLPKYDERDNSDAAPGPETLVQRHAHGKAHSVAGVARERPVLGVDTAVLVDGQVYGKPESESDAERMLEALSGRTHEVVSGLCLLAPAWEELHTEKTAVAFRPLTARDIAWYLATHEWENRAGGYAIQRVGAGLVERIDGDYLNVVGLPAALLIRLLAARFSGIYGYG